MQRRLEPEVMDSLEEAIEYDAMDFTEVNTTFAKQAIALVPTEEALVLDAGTGTGRIPVLMSQMRPQWRFIAIDLAENMLKIAAQHWQQTSSPQQIRWELVDAKHLPYHDEQFDLVISNSLIHHLPEPLLFFSELKRVTKPNGSIFIRDLFRPADEETINALVDSIGVEYNQHQTKLFRDSLHAALTLDEVNQLISEVGLPRVKVYQSSDRHWTAEQS
ncbi:methylase involved in ubiquinone/menaquinone biosynthesis [Cylindrospermum stagnale PCC 7417]|uniref:Methylase involved in ubiquinone/menaquinone biosynthesis n=1 Tax=Cylindrospermum stagnale PCC 7417 TaxID=56107 RepID=K9WUJ3_9NOST|nr:class I SAM-dependent methyltransferase [Cylindrospermum stagnale]AFZ23474.1 methylase involved in ubiquinone/menaquinone biosynthesis [Cylindrospermum stagnale PCC 7417]